MAILVQFLEFRLKNCFETLAEFQNSLFAFFYAAAFKTTAFHFRIAWLWREELVFVPGKIAHGIFFGRKNARFFRGRWFGFGF